MLRLKSSILLIIFLLLAITITASPVLACSGGGGPTLEQSILNAGVIVRGQFVERDIVSQNYVLQVASYLSGEAGPEYLLVAFNHPITTQGLIDGKLGSGDCNWLYSPLPLNRSGYFMLAIDLYDATSLDETGVYQAGSYSFVAFDHEFPAEFYTHDGNVEFSQAELNAYIAELRQSEPIVPLSHSRYPATAPLIVMTESGEEYLLTVTGRHLQRLERIRHEPYYPCSFYQQKFCQLWYAARLSSDGRSLIQPTADGIAYIACESCSEFEINADSFRLSPIGLAAWHESTLTIYALHDRLQYSSSDRIPGQVAQFTLEPDALANADHSAWSADGQLLAFSDARGLWLWDVFLPDSEPRLLIPAGHDVPFALEFSGQNRYLSIEQGNERFSLDLISDARLPLSYFSPDEQLKLDCLPDEAKSAEAGRPICTLQLYQLAPYSSIPLWGIPVEAGFRIRWVNERRVLIQLCDYGEKRCGMLDLDAYARDDYGDYSILMSPYMEYDLQPALDFAVNGRNVAILVDDNTLEVNGDTLNFEMGSPIVALRWLPLVFYGESPYVPLP